MTFDIKNYISVKRISIIEILKSLKKIGKNGIFK